MIPEAARISRARLLGAVGALSAAAGTGCAAHVAMPFARSSRTQLVTLGTGGGPQAGLPRHMSANVIVHDGEAYVVDCGLGVTAQLVRAGVALESVRNVFLTHHHPDHNVEYGPLLLLSWIAGRTVPVAAFGPPPLARMTAEYERMQAFTAEEWSHTVDTPPFPKTIVRERTTGGVVLRTDRVTVTCALVRHPPIRPAFAYRFDFPDRSIVFSGDTVESAALVALAKGADVLVHEAMYYPAMAVEMEALGVWARVRGRRAANSPRSILASVRADHTPVDRAGAVAAAAAVKTLVLSHLVPPVGVPDAVWHAEAARHFRGRIVVARDLGVIEP